ncbi:MAG: tRNA pseudouridine(38-40) synthase TruA [Jaaginema sp. PMC 1079.18]|nr:tRNA pseudouridine(38-40) synthase TruA [Jaaginema sp. PMC 1080.18]MEC4852626.1 tRNA pseudouridine(38-40) synthase TruA [Jaaginema sp. PMC 1079.18]MEC4865919.1 tRNA pseudouridine(38-40) synthase TruA [Jaaginema sp. PMC 1078.18]
MNAEAIPPQRVALVIQYLGTHYHGWQRQLHHRTVQEDIESAIASVLSQPTTIWGAGRTDAGVHAVAQVAHFNAPGPIPASKWAKILNGLLSDEIIIRASAAVNPDWHAQYSAVWRRYRYLIYTDRHPNLFVAPFCWHYYHAPLDTDKMQAALKPMLGKHDFSAFRRAGSARKDSWLEIQAVELTRNGPLIQLEIQASGFLYGMVRLLVGTLVMVGNGKISPAAFTDLWVQQQREKIKYAAPAQGLCLLRVGYLDFPFAPEVWFDTQPQFILNS